MSRHVEIFEGPGEMRSRLRAIEWAGCGLGPPQAWPGSLKAAVGLMLDAHLPMWVCWGPSLVLLYNDRYAELLGLRHPAALLRPFSAVWEASPHPWAAALAAAQPGQPATLDECELVFLRKGQPVQAWFSFSTSALRDDAGRVGGLLGTAVETTAQVLARQQSARENALTADPQGVQHRRATDHEAFQLAFADRIRALESPDEVVSTASALLGQHLNLARVVYGAADAAGDILTMKPDWTNGHLPSLAGVELRLADFGPLIVGAVAAGRHLVIPDVTTDARSAPYASAYAANGVRAFVAIPLMKGGRLRAILSLHDTSPRQWTPQEVALAHDMVDRTWAAAESAQADAELRRERDQSQYIFDSMTEGFAVLDRHWNVARVNAEGLRMTQRAAHEVIGRSHWTLWPAMKSTELDHFFEQLRRTPQRQITEVRFTFAGGRQGWMEVRAYPLLDSGMALFFRDITERKSSQAQLEDADRRKDEFLAMLAHELRNPLAPITAAAALLRTSRLDEEQISTTSRIIERQVHHMTRLVDDLLDVSRVTLGLIELENTPLDVHQMVNEAVEQVTPLVQARHHHLSVQMAPERCWVRGDRQRLVQVLANILNNAAKYTPEGGELRVGTRVRGGEVLMEVADNGAGMAPDMLTRAFDLFSQAGRTSDRSSGGLGLGLALVKSLVELHHGQVWCESPGLDQGTTFTVALPRLQTPEPPAAARQAEETRPASSPSLRILVVDDNVDAASMLAMLLELWGHQVWIEHGWRGALERAQREAPQVCLLDIGLPEVDGNELVQMLRALPETAQSLFVAVTGYGQANDRRQTLAAGFHHHLVKPVDTDKLSAILEAFARA